MLAREEAGRPAPAWVPPCPLSGASTQLLPRPCLASGIFWGRNARTGEPGSAPSPLTLLHLKPWAATPQCHSPLGGWLFSGPGCRGHQEGSPA